MSVPPEDYKTCKAEQDALQDEFNDLEEELKNQLHKLRQARKQQRELKALDANDQGQDHAEAMTIVQAEIDELQADIASDQKTAEVYETQIARLERKLQALAAPNPASAPLLANPGLGNANPASAPLLANPGLGNANPASANHANPGLGNDHSVKFKEYKGLPKFTPTTELHTFFLSTEALHTSRMVPAEIWVNHLPSQCDGYPNIVIWVHQAIILPRKNWEEAKTLFYERYNKGQNVSKAPRDKYTEYSQRHGQTCSAFFTELNQLAFDADVDLNHWYTMDDIRNKKMLKSISSLLKLTDARFEDYTFDELHRRSLLLDSANIDFTLLGSALCLTTPSQNEPKYEQDSKTEQPKSDQRCTFPTCMSTKHKTKNCPVKKAAVCDICGMKGSHLSEHCFKSASSSSADGNAAARPAPDLSGVQCRKCKGYGHYANSKDCPGPFEPSVRQPPRPVTTPNAPQIRTLKVEEKSDVELAEIKEANLAIRGDDGNYHYNG